MKLSNISLEKHCRLSLAEKMQLFQQKQNNKDAATKRDAPVTRRKQRVQSRFRTQVRDSRVSHHLKMFFDTTSSQLR